MKFPLVFRSTYDWAYDGWNKSVTRLEMTIRDLTALRIADAQTIAALQTENANLWKILNRNANKPQRRDRSGKFAKSVSEF